MSLWSPNLASVSSTDLIPSEVMSLGCPSPRNLIDGPLLMETNQMKLNPKFKHVLQWDQLLSIAESPQIRRLHAFANGRAVVLVGAFVRSIGRIQHWFVQVTKAGVTAALVPDQVTARFDDLKKQQQGSDRWSERSFSLGERVGLLLSDKWIYLFEDIHHEPLSIQIENPFAMAPSYRSSHVPISFDPVVCGVSTNNRVPVIFRHPDESYEYACFLSLLEIDIPARQARWLSKSAEGHPTPLIFRPRPGVNQSPSNVGTYLDHVAWTGSEYLAYSIGSNERPTYHGMGMDYAVLLRCTMDCEDVALIMEEGESVYGHILSSMDKVLLTPMFKSVRKDKQSLHDLEHNLSIAIELPRGYAGFRIFDGGPDGLLWSVNDVEWLKTDWHALKNGKPTYIAAFSGGQETTLP
jgi:hypothetical protein